MQTIVAPQIGAVATIGSALMTDRPRKSFLAPPSLGGKLTHLNANFWVILLLLARGGTLDGGLPVLLDASLQALTLFFALPFAVFALLPTVGTPPQATFVDVVMIALVLAINAFVWGYGLAWILQRVKNLFCAPKTK